MDWRAEWKKRVVEPALVVLRQGLTPHALALSVSFGIAIGLIPFPAVSTVLCVAVAAALRLNQGAIQLGNYGAGAGQIAFFPPYIRLGEWLFNDTPLPFSASQLSDMLQEDAGKLVRELWTSLWHAVVAWLATVPPIVGVLYLVLRPVLERALKRRAALVSASAEPVSGDGQDRAG